MNPPRADGLSDTIVLSDTTRFEQAVLKRGNVTPAGGKELPPELPEDSERIPRAVMQELERVSRAIGRQLRFEVDLDRGQAVIHVLDRATGELIRRIPREELKPLVQEQGRFELRLFDQWA